MSYHNDTEKPLIDLDDHLQEDKRMSNENKLSKYALSEDELDGVVGGLENGSNLLFKKEDKKKTKMATTLQKGGQPVPINLLDKSAKC